ncbi:MAG: SBBP repeat-containing protein [Hormoscilla sp. GM7CHS1pb]|nr:SBBP repeat-containing protein [Hormoscilla sp. GM7CHS1pb]
MAAPRCAIGGGSQDAFIVKLSPTGTALDYSSYLGGSGRERGRAIAIDGDGAAYVTGVTNESESILARPFPTEAALQEDYGCATLRDRWGFGRCFCLED